MSEEREWNCEDPKKRLEWAEATTEALRVLEGKWKIVIICQLFGAKEPLRFSELERRCEGVNQKMLIQQLKELEADGLVQRTDYKEVPPRVDYSLTPLGRSLAEALVPLCSWGTENMAEVARVFARRDALISKA